jgi:opacity protein-like surface antigen
MKKYLFALAMVTAIVPVANAEAFKTSNYVSGALGWTFTPDNSFSDPDLAAVGAPTSGEFELDDAMNFAVAIGARVAPSVRAEVEVSYRNPDIETVSLDGIGDLEAFAAANGLPVDIIGKIQTFALMVNGYYDFMPDQMISPYISLGAGLARHDGEISVLGVTEEGDDMVFAYQAGAGVSIDIADCTELFGGYRYLVGPEQPTTC